MDITTILWYIVVLVISAIPLNIAVKFMGGRSSLIKVIIANIIIAIISYFIKENINFLAGFLSFIAMLFVYKLMFRMGWLRSFLAWLLQYVIIAIFFIILALIGILAVPSLLLF